MSWGEVVLSVIGMSLVMALVAFGLAVWGKAAALRRADKVLPQ